MIDTSEAALLRLTLTFLSPAYKTLALLQITPILLASTVINGLLTPYRFSKHFLLNI